MHINFVFKPAYGLEIHHPSIASPHQGHPTTLYENDHYIPGKDTASMDSDDIKHVHLNDETNLQHHTHHVVTVKNEAEKQKMVHGLVDMANGIKFFCVYESFFVKNI